MSSTRSAYFAASSMPCRSGGHSTKVMRRFLPEGIECWWGRGVWVCARAPLRRVPHNTRMHARMQACNVRHRHHHHRCAPATTVIGPFTSPRFWRVKCLTRHWMSVVLPTCRPATARNAIFGCEVQGAQPDQIMELLPVPLQLLCYCASHHEPWPINNHPCPTMKPAPACPSMHTAPAPTPCCYCAAVPLLKTYVPLHAPAWAFLQPCVCAHVCEHKRHQGQGVQPRSARPHQCTTRGGDASSPCAPCLPLHDPAWILCVETTVRLTCGGPCTSTTRGGGSSTSFSIIGAAQKRESRADMAMQVLGACGQPSLEDMHGPITTGVGPRLRMG